MQNNSFRQDINGLRAIAVIAVVLFHFNASWMPGGFAGVDVFFVISGFLMTGIIFRGIEQENFSILKFYVARANRIIPALAVLCLVLLVFGWFYLTPLDYKALGKHAASSVAFLSNIIYWRESGYFDAASHEKWLLHTWSLSVEWQFYIIYPLILVSMRKFMSIKTMKSLLLVGTILGFIFCVIATYKWPNPSYYLLPTRAWEMMLGGIAYLYPLSLQENRKKLFEWIGLGLIISSYFLISSENPWPGYLAIFPVLGSFLLIQANRNNSIVTNNFIFQKLGTWSYSIYLWHWPLVVAIYIFSLNEYYTYLGVLLSIFLGFLSHQYIERIKFRNNYSNLNQYIKFKPAYMSLILIICGVVVFIENGFIKLSPAIYQKVVNTAIPSPYREKCHINEYQPANQSCEYFSSNVRWATFGDSHTVELAYALAKKLQYNNIGLKHFSFSGCIPSYKEDDSFSKCAKWYNESANYILKNKNIENVVIAHRYPNELSNPDQNTILKRIDNIDKLIIDLAKEKENIYVLYPIPELKIHVNKIIDKEYRDNGDIKNINGSSLASYKEGNNIIINHFNNSNYPKNVHLIKSQDAFCDNKNCFSVKDSSSMYFDDNHLSIAGANRLVELIK